MKALAVMTIWLASSSTLGFTQTGELMQGVGAAFQLLEEGKRAEALAAFEELIPPAKAAENRWVEAEALRGIGQILNFRAEYDQAEAQISRAIEIHLGTDDPQALGRSFNALAYTRWAQGKRTEARQLYLKAREQYETAGSLDDVAAVVYNLAFLSPSLEEREKTIPQALEAARRAGNRRLEGKVIHMEADSKAYVGDYVEALERLSRALRIFHEIDAKVEAGRVLTSLGRLYRIHGRIESAVRLYEEAMALQEKTGDKQGVIQSLGTIAIAYKASREPERALPYAEKALELAHETGAAHLIRQAEVILADIKLDLGEAPVAVEIFERVLSSDFQTNGAVEAGVAAAYGDLGRLDEALEMAGRAVAVARQRRSTETLLQALFVRSAIAEQLGKNELAVADLDAALETLEEVRKRLIPVDYMKRGFMQRRVELYDRAVSLHYLLGHEARALEIAEQSKSRAFLDLIASKALHDNEVNETPRSDQEEGGNFDFTGKSLGAPLPQVLRGFWQQGRGTHRSELAVESPVSAETPVLTDMIEAAKRLDSVLVAYYSTQESLYAWVVRKEGTIDAVRVPVGREEVTRQVELALSSLPSAGRGRGSVARPAHEAVKARRSDGESRSAWRSLHRMLIEPIDGLLQGAGSERLMILPHGSLFRVPFAALPDERGVYLLEKYVTGYALSASVLELFGSESPAKPSYLLIGDPLTPPLGLSGERLAPLPATRVELESIAEIAVKKGHSAKRLTQAGALETALRSEAPGKTILHFATHGVILDDDPFASFLALQAAGISPESDGKLTAAEVYDLRLDADLVVLSACGTALGEVSGDGIIGLTRAFFYAGTRSIVASLWDVADEPTLAVISSFYQHLEAGAGKDVALRAAQLQLLNRLREGDFSVETPLGSMPLTENPVFWAGFVLLGHP